VDLLVAHAEGLNSKAQSMGRMLAPRVSCYEKTLAPDVLKIKGRSEIKLHFKMPTGNLKKK